MTAALTISTPQRPPAPASPSSANTAAIKRPFISLWAATAFLDTNENAIMRDIECGRFLWAFDFAVARFGKKRCVRIFTMEVLDRKAGVRSNYDLAGVVASCFPAICASFRLVQVVFAFHLSDQSVIRLVRAGHLKLVDPSWLSSRKKRETCHWPPITRASLAEFVAQRRIQ